MKACVRFAPMIGSREGELPADEARALAEHLAGCRDCRALAAEVEAGEGLLAEGLLAQANARDFAPFVDQVMARVERGAPAPADPRPRLPAWLAFLRLHWKLASSGAVAVLAAAAVFMYVQRDVSEPEQLAAVEIDLQGGNTVLQTADGPVVLLEPDDSGA